MEKTDQVQSQTTLQIKDSRLVVAMLDNQKEKHNWLSKLMTIENIRGTATINMANNTIFIPYAFVKSDMIDIGAKGVISSALREGMFFLRYKKLKLLLKTRNGKKNIDMLKTKETFNNYAPPRVSAIYNAIHLPSRAIWGRCPSFCLYLAVSIPMQKTVPKH